MTTGNGVEANNVVLNAAFSSPDSTSLTLEAHKAITVNAAVSIGSGSAELELQSDTLDATHALSFERKGHITFGNLSDIFGINGGIFTLVGSVQELASAVKANPSGAFALANNYDASGDGTYSQSPVPTTLAGTFDGLGNAVENLSIKAKTGAGLGFFPEVTGTVERFRLSNAVVHVGIEGGAEVGMLVGLNEGSMSQDFASGVISGQFNQGFVGGLTGSNTGSVDVSSAHVKLNARNITGNRYPEVGGLVGVNYGTITRSYATGQIVGYLAGGLVGNNYGTIGQCYATGGVEANGQAFYVSSGGLVGVSQSGTTIEDSYSTGKVGGGFAGGLVGFDWGSANTDLYWDTDTSGITNLSQGAGDPPNDPGITGLTTQQFQSGLPAGFDPKIWAEKSNIDNGLPYLIANPPPK